MTRMSCVGTGNPQNQKSVKPIATHCSTAFTMLQPACGADIMHANRCVCERTPIMSALAKSASDCSVKPALLCRSSAPLHAHSHTSKHAFFCRRPLRVRRSAPVSLILPAERSLTIVELTTGPAEQRPASRESCRLKHFFE